MRFVTAVALATVMLWVPVDVSGQSGQEVTIETVEMHTMSGLPLRTYITFRTRNNTSRTIVAWRGHLEIRSPFDELIWEGDLLFGEDNDLLFGEEVISAKRMDYQNKIAGFDFEDYQATDLKLRWSNLEVAYAP